MNSFINLDCACPEDVAKILRQAAQRYGESEGELQAAWGDEKAGRVWRELAKILDRAADQCDKACAKYV